MMALDALKADENAMRKTLEDAGSRFRGRGQCTCCFHQDGHASASVSLKDGVCLFHCFVCDWGGDIIAVRAKLNKRTPAEELRAMNDAEFIPPMKRHVTEPPPEIFPSVQAIIARYRYHVEDEYSDLYADPETGEATFTSIRHRGPEGKRFCQCFKVAGGWQSKKPAGFGKYPLANRKAVAAADTVVWVEGEKALRALAKVGIVAATTPGGAKNIEQCDITPLAGKKIILWPDNDEAGIGYSKKGNTMLEALEPLPRPYWLSPDVLELPERGDAFDFIARFHGWTPDEIRGAVEDALEDAKALGVKAELDAEYAAIAAGQRRALPFGKWPTLTKTTKALMPGTVTMICGDSGATKSFFLLEAALCWQEIGFKWCIYELEEDRAFHAKRALAQYIGEGRITDNEWAEVNAAMVAELRQEHSAWESAFAERLIAQPEDDIDLDGLGDWIETRSQAGYEIIAADPITAVDSGKDPWITERKFLLRVKRISRRYSSRIILVTHPTKGTKRDFASSNMAGSTNFSRFTQTIMWMERRKDETVFVQDRTSSIPNCVTSNRRIHLLKTRNSVGAGLVIAFYFDPLTLRFLERGIIVDDPEGD